MTSNDRKRMLTFASTWLRFAVTSLSKASERETIKSGACVGTSSTANAVPLPLIGEGLSAVEVEARLTMSDATLLTSRLSAHQLITLREGERLFSTQKAPDTESIFSCIERLYCLLPTAYCLTTTSAYANLITFSKSAGANSTWNPIRPPETQIVAQSFADASTVVVKNFFIPIGEQPP